ncbi:phosphatase PAP2 family protein [Gilvimarinus polysaccharolyticus]|uniref:phosphatase PAP2 family protein n=1 Tax=Gilvimarinus polysaccharolyticus TaxID=863921 RepID=UPI0006739A29|nr:phosphatase PAP2 family protein [Gilvimarinus polysaccharolyticus]
MNAFLQRVHQIDTWAFIWLHVTKQFPYRRTVRWVSRCGDGPLYTLIALGLMAFNVPHSHTFLYLGLICYALDVSLYLLLKNGIKRNRPAAAIDIYEGWFTPSDQFSFPSGHTAAAFVFAFLILSFYPLFAIPAYLMATLIGISRVLLGVHFPTDIIAGAVLGTGCAVVGSFIYTGIIG